MSATVDELERLAALHRSGALTDDEFAAQKANLLVSPASLALNKIWRKRFTFFEAHGSPFSASGAAALAKLPFWEASRIRLNVWGFLFGPFYFFFLGLWKRGLVLAVLAFALLLVADWLFGPGVDRAVGVGEAMIFALTVNYYRFVKVTQGRDEWNPLTDLVSR